MRFLAGALLGWCVVFSSFGWQDNENASPSSSHYISDDVFIFIHTGPGRNYRILGSVEAGMPVSRTESAATGEFVEIIDPQGRTGWIESQYLTVQPSFRAQIPQFQEQLADQQAQLRPLQQQISELRSNLRDEQQQTATLEEALKKANQTIQKLEVQQENNEQDMQIRWLLNGGGLVIGSVLLGVLITYLPKKRKRNDGWMN